ncbi:ABC transporter ATP-binding protein [Bacteroides sp. 214]|uniref:ribosomal protection-like ABC-F family protein n=1 Tax=Bacteroides sp. 214 TaxID=2302935 RepID=UPI0013D34BC0|nr:ABC-F family ATP-binding cassette domain-containing protein [Bacteroides sp. 214]NDW12408.1 ABC transporter ATP-binding protein [Bacteroides sp. 214]
MSIVISNLSYIHPDQEILFEHINFSVQNGEKKALIGNNGSGKSTLLQVIAGKLRPSEGSVHVSSEGLYYVPQHFGQYDELTIAEAMQVDQKLNALHAILQGEVTEEHFAVLNDDWNIEEESIAALSYWGLQEFPLSHPLHAMSGGEKTKVFLAGMKVNGKSVILLDEPTNHLDFVYRNKLYDWLKNCKCTLLVVSHDRTLLDLLPSTLELSRSEVKLYGGNYSFYKEQKIKETEALYEKLEEQEKQLRLAKKAAREVAEKQQKHSSRGEKQNIKKGVPRILMGNLKNKSENSSAKLKEVHEEKTADMVAKIKELQQVIPSSAALKTNFHSSALHSGKLLIEGSGVLFGFGKHYLWEEPLDFQIRSGERWAISGKNGGGKTTLLKLMTGELTPTEGTVKTCENLSTVYLDQEYSLIQNHLSVLEQAMTYKTATMQEHELKVILNRFLFPVATWNKPCSKLSGGEKMRLSFCCLMAGNNTPDIFVLDEPTNNLDIQSIEIITSTIREYKGTVLVVSHDTYFLQEIGVDKEIALGINHLI